MIFGWLGAEEAFASQQNTRVRPGKTDTRSEVFLVYLKAFSDPQ